MDDSVNKWQFIRTSLFRPIDLFQTFVESMPKPTGNWKSADVADTAEHIEAYSPRAPGWD
jgi:hypothetical protein